MRNPEEIILLESLELQHQLYPELSSFSVCFAFDIPKKVNMPSHQNTEETQCNTAAIFMLQNVFFLKTSFVSRAGSNSIFLQEVVEFVLFGEYICLDCKKIVLIKQMYLSTFPQNLNQWRSSPAPAPTLSSLRRTLSWFQPSSS